MTVLFLVAAAIFLASLAAQFGSRTPAVAKLARGIGAAAVVVALGTVARSSPDCLVVLAGGSMTAGLAVLMSGWN